MERRIGLWLSDAQLVAAETADGLVTRIERCRGESPIAAWEQWSRKRHPKCPITVALDLAGQSVRAANVRDAPDDIMRAQLAEKAGTSLIDGDAVVCGRAIPGSGPERLERRVAIGKVSANVVATIGGSRAGRRAIFTLAPFVLPSDGAYCVIASGHCWLCVVEEGVPTHSRHLEAEGLESLSARLGGADVLHEAVTGRAGPETLAAVDAWLDGLALELDETGRSWQSTLSRSVGPWTLLGAETEVIGPLLQARLEGYRTRVRRPLAPERGAGVDQRELSGCSIAAWAATADLDALSRLVVPRTPSQVGDAMASMRRQWKSIAGVAAFATVALGLPLTLGSLQTSQASSLLADTHGQASRLTRYAALGAYDRAMSSVVTRASATEPPWSKLIARALALAPPGVVVTQASFGEVGSFVSAQVQADATGATPAVATQWASALRAAGMEGVTVPQLSSSAGGTTFEIGFAERT